MAPAPRQISLHNVQRFVTTGYVENKRCLASTSAAVKLSCAPCSLADGEVLNRYCEPMSSGAPKFRKEEVRLPLRSNPTLISQSDVRTIEMRRRAESPTHH